MGAGVWLEEDKMLLLSEESAAPTLIGTRAHVCARTCVTVVHHVSG